MNLENGIKDVITQKLEDGTVEKLIAEELEKGIKSSLESLFRSYGSVGKIIEKQIESVMVPYLEAYDYSKYITKLDDILVEILQNTTLDNRKILENFKDLMECKDIKKIKVSEIFDKWMDYVAREIDTSELEIDYDDGVSYEYADVTMEVVYEEERSWSSIKYATIVLECEKDEEMNKEIRISNYRDEGWRFESTPVQDIRSLRRVDTFSIFLMNLAQSYASIIIDEEHAEEGVRPEAEPEASFS